jgi:protein-S-isoprenylcysteine O-methyltransferase Ste14
MNWRFRPIPETADLPPAEQRQLWISAGRDRSRKSDLFAVAFALLVVGFVFALLLTATAELLPGWARWPLWNILFVGGGLIIDAVIVVHRRRVVRRLRGG